MADSFTQESRNANFCVYYASKSSRTPNHGSDAKSRTQSQHLSNYKHEPNSLLQSARDRTSLIARWTTSLTTFIVLYFTLAAWNWKLHSIPLMWRRMRPVDSRSPRGWAGRERRRWPVWNPRPAAQKMDRSPAVEQVRKICRVHNITSNGTYWKLSTPNEHPDGPAVIGCCDVPATPIFFVNSNIIFYKYWYCS